jgi:hypothetical protein
MIDQVAATISITRESDSGVLRTGGWCYVRGRAKGCRPVSSVDRQLRQHRRMALAFPLTTARDVLWQHASLSCRMLSGDRGAQSVTAEGGVATAAGPTG